MARFRGFDHQRTGTGERPRIAVFAGPTATILNSHPLITSDKAADKYELPPLRNPDGSRPRWDILRPQRLAAPVTVYIEQFSAHPLERDAAELYAAPDGYVGSDGRFSPEQRSEADRPVYEVTLAPEDGLYLLPYMARQADGSAWDGDAAEPGAPPERSRQPFYPDAARLFEEIDRFEVAADGRGNLLSRLADFEFHRAVPSGGYTKGLPEPERTDAGTGDIPPEQLGVDYFPYRPRHLRREPPAAMLARLTNVVQGALAAGRYAGAIWLEGSPFVEETSYWLNLLIDTPHPIAACAGNIGTPGRQNVIDAVRYLVSGTWADEEGRDRVGVVGIHDHQIMTARELQKADDRPGGFIATGGHGGVVGSVGANEPQLTFWPTRSHTHRSELRASRLPRSVRGTRTTNGQIQTLDVRVTDELGRLEAASVPQVTIVKHARYLPRTANPDVDVEVEIRERTRWNLTNAPLAGLVVEGGTPYGHVTPGAEIALREAAFSGIPFAKSGRGNADGFVHQFLVPFGIAASNLTATKARMLLMACLIHLGALPPARDPAHPTPDEEDAVRRKFAEYQHYFDTH